MNKSFKALEGELLRPVTVEAKKVLAPLGFAATVMTVAATATLVAVFALPMLLGLVGFIAYHFKKGYDREMRKGGS